MTIDIAKLATDAAYWDSVAGTATHYCPSNRQFYDFRLHPCCIHRPQSEWVDGLPLVGSICEARHNKSDCWIKREILAIGETMAFVRIIPGQVDDDGDPVSGEHTLQIAYAEFRPIKTKAQRDKDELAKFLRNFDKQRSIQWCEDAADAIIAAGWTKP